MRRIEVNVIPGHSKPFPQKGHPSRNLLAVAETPLASDLMIDCQLEALARQYCSDISFDACGSS